MARATALICTGLALVSAGCSTYSHRYRFMPVLTEIEVGAPGREDAGVRTFATVRGVRAADPEKLIDESLEMRLRLENATDAPVTLTAENLELVSGDLRSFGEPHLEPAGTSFIPPGDFLLVTAWFPFPDNASPEELDLSALVLRWTILVDGKPVSRRAIFSATQERRYLYYGGHHYPYCYGHYFPYYGYRGHHGFYGHHGGGYH